MTAPSEGASRPARILSTVVLPQAEWPMMHKNSPRAIDSHKSSNTVVLPPPAVGKRLLTLSFELNFSVMGCNIVRQMRGAYSEPRSPLPQEEGGFAFVTA